MTQEPAGKDVLFFFIDALRWDVVANDDEFRILMPNVWRITRSGIKKKLISNAQTTQFVMPSLLTQTYPLDYGGYNNGIGERPRSFVELLSRHDYQTLMVESADIDGTFGQCERGFDRVYDIYDKRLPIEGYLKKRLQYHVKRWQQKHISDAEIWRIIDEDYDRLLRDLENTEQRRIGSKKLPRRLRRYTRRDIRRIQKERKMISSRSSGLLKKLSILQPLFYFDYLGKPMPRFWFRVRGRFRSGMKRLQVLLNRTVGFPYDLVTSRPRTEPIAKEILDATLELISTSKQPWFAYSHVLDVKLHDELTRPFATLSHWRFFGRYRTIRKLKRRRGEAYTRTISYDLALAYVDHQIGRAVERLEKNHCYNDTTFVFFGDHGDGWDKGRAATLISDFGFRTHYEHITVPLLVANPPPHRAVSDAGVHDAMSISATVLELLGIRQDPSFRGRSIFSDGKEAAISECAGRGNADIVRNDLYFTVTTANRKAMVKLSGESINIERFYDTEKDPRELENVASDASYSADMRAMLSFLYEERRDLLESRGVNKHALMSATQHCQDAL